MPELEPITREEKFLNGEVGMTPITREEKILAGEDIETVTRREYFLKKYRGGGGGDITVVPLSVTENGTYSEEGKAYSPVQVSVPAPVLKTKNITDNGTYNASDDNADGYSQVSVNVPIPQNAYLLKSVNTPTPIASFNDGEEMVMPSLKVAIEPQQDLHGYDSPWVGGAGKNKCSPNFSDWTIGSAYLYFQIPNFTDSVYVMSLVDNDTSVDLTGINVGFMNNYPTENTEYRWIINNGVVQDNKTNVSGISQVNCNTIIIYPRTESAFNIVFSRYKIQVEIGTTATSFAPYSNICPIIGWSAVDVTIQDDIDNPTTTETITIQLGDTYYGGEVDVVNGIVTPAPYYASYNGETLTGEWISDRDKYEVGTTPTIGAQVVNIGASGTPVSILPTAIKSLRGVNNVYANTGDIKDAEYFSKEV